MVVLHLFAFHWTEVISLAVIESCISNNLFSNVLMTGKAIRCVNAAFFNETHLLR